MARADVVNYDPCMEMPLEEDSLDNPVADGDGKRVATLGWIIGGSENGRSLGGARYLRYRRCERVCKTDRSICAGYLRQTPTLE